MIPTNNGDLINRVIELESENVRLKNECAGWTDEFIKIAKKLSIYTYDNVRLKKQAQKSICQSCVQMSSKCDSQEYEIEQLETSLLLAQSGDNKILTVSLLEENEVLSADNEALKQCVDILKLESAMFLSRLKKAEAEVKSMQGKRIAQIRARIYTEIEKLGE